MLLRQSIAYSVARIVPAAIAIPALAIYTRLLSPAEYGTYIVAITVVGFAHSTMLSWLWITVLRLCNDAKQSGTFLTATLLCYATILALAGLCAMAIFAWTSADGLFVFLGFITFAVVGWVELNMYMLRAGLESGLYLSISIFRAVVSTAASVTFAVAGLGAIGLMTGTIVGTAVPALWLTYRGWRGLDRLDSESLREILRYGLPLGAGFISEAASSNADRLVLAALQQTEAVGLYGAAYSLASRIVTSIVDPIGTAGFSLAVRALEEEGPAAAVAQLRRNILLLMAIGLPVVVGLIVVAPDLTAVMIGPDFREPATRLLPYVIVSCFLISLRRQYCEVAFHLSRKTGLYARTILAVAVLGIGSSFFLIPGYGPDGAAYAMLITHGLGFGLTLYTGSKVFPLPLPYLGMFKLTAAALTMAAIASSIPSGHGIFSLVGKASVGAITYVALLLIFDVDAARSTVLRWLRHTKSPDA